MMLKRGVTQLIDLIEERVFDRSVPPLRETGRKRENGVATLLPPLSDELVLQRIWPLFHKRVNISLLWRLRRVNRAWRESVGRSLEWVALEFVRVDTPGLIRYLEERGECRPPLRERVEDELRSILVLMSENVADFAPQSASLQQGVEDRRRSVGDRRSAEDIFEVETGRPKLDCLYPEKSCSTCSESEGFGEVWSPSSDESLRVYFPRHSVRA